MRFKEKLTKLLKERRWTRADLMDAIGRPGTDGTVYNWLHRNSLPAADTAVDIARALGVSVEYLIDDTIDEYEPARTETRVMIEGLISRLGEKEALNRLIGTAGRDTVVLVPGDYDAKPDQSTVKSTDKEAKRRSS